MNKSLLYLLANIGLFDRDLLDDAQGGQQLLRAVCPVHEGGDNRTAFVLKTDCWHCNTKGCHSTYGGRLEGLVVGLANRYGEKEGLTRDRNGLPLFREARLWVKRNARRLREVFKDWPTAKEGGGSHSRGAEDWLACPREVMRDALAIPSPYFLQRGFAPDTLVRYDIGNPRSWYGGLFPGLRNYAVVPLYDLSNAWQCVGYVARAIDDWTEPRWKFSTGFPNGQRLFNYPPAREVNRTTGQVILVEGVADALCCVEAGFPQTVAVLGSALYDEQVAWLTKLRLEEVVVVGDNDEAGAKFAAQVKNRFSGLVAAVRIIHPPVHVKDIGELNTLAARKFLMDALKLCKPPDFVPTAGHLNGLRKVAAL
jgi:5S rRNA maturation endonuclease (ribonuclease M5)